MGTDIYGGIEYRHPFAGNPSHSGETWLFTVDLEHLYGDRDYLAFGCLFGVRNYADFEPLAEYRGLPDDASDRVRALLEGTSANTWVTWAELEAMDLSATPRHKDYLGMVSWSTIERPDAFTLRPVGAEWDRSVINAVGPPPPGWTPQVEHMTWDTDGRHVEYKRLTAGTILSPEESNWPYVAAVMKALADCLGGDEVRLVVGFG